MTERPASRKGLILSLNSGSSSLKISLYRLESSSAAVPDSSDEPVTLIISSSLSSISRDATFSFAAVEPGVQVEKLKDEPAPQVKDHASGFTYFLDHLKRAVGIDREQIVHVCHRIVHGGDYFKPVVITKSTYHHIETLSDLAPLHNGAALSVIKVCLTELPHANSIAYFDTSFHYTIPTHISSYAIDQKIARPKGLRKYGFHGLSYAYILRAVSRHLKKASLSPISDTNLIVLHLGSGASACAIQKGRSFDTSMGLTPAAGLPGATRAGTIDPTLIFHYTHDAAKITHSAIGMRDVGITEAEDILNKRSGWNALTGTTDFGAIIKRRSQGDADAQLAFDLFVDRILDFVGAYFLKLSGAVDALVFSGGIGERAVDLRKVVVDQCKCLGFVLDDGKNTGVGDVEGEVVEIGDRVLVCRTDEQLEMARECALEDRFWV
ncbi:Acetokinase family-domain-containing protein [Vararia minispora EC-137]|uniref:Acetokinase family-domain-containing protein n=1 Tax=Vararia minispora EC-137 TaxID=1314806 RepID=A0ACB8QV95_9AGAM|nr:Acetokinase family-domain-containing protein [Vararia minispora EC-137]